MDIIIQKFGGTSLSSKERREMVVNKILDAKKRGKALVVVVSAIGRKGDPYATDTLRSFVLEHYPNCSLKYLDLLMSCGEIISASMLGAALEDSKNDVCILTGPQAGIITDSRFGDAEILYIDKNKILPHLKDGKILIVAGFQGCTEEGVITTLGRGGSDTTATALGVALDAECVEIYTDVNGIMTADPNIVAKAKIIDELNYDEVFQMAEKGAKIIHPRAVEIAEKGNLSVKIKNTMSNHPGTMIHFCKKKSKNPYTYEYSKISITAITHKDNIAQVSVWVDDNEKKDSHLLSALAENLISIDMINLFLDKKVFTVEEKHLSKVEQIFNDLGFSYEVLKNCSKVTIIGSRISGIPGIMASIVSSLEQEDIKILQSSDSHSTISCLVKGVDANRSVNILHDVFELN